MNIKVAQNLLTLFIENIPELSSKIKNLEYDANNPDEKLFFDILINDVLDNLLYSQAKVKYTNTPVAYTGILKICKAHFFIDDFQLRNKDTIEVFFNDEWILVEINKVCNEFHIDILPICKLREENIKARIRLSDKDFNERTKTHPTAEL